MSNFAMNWSIRKIVENEEKSDKMGYHTQKYHWISTPSVGVVP